MKHYASGRNMVKLLLFIHCTGHAIFVVCEAGAENFSRKWNVKHIAKLISNQFYWSSEQKGQPSMITGYMKRVMWVSFYVESYVERECERNIFESLGNLRLSII